MTFLLKPMFSLLSPSGATARLSVLIFHRVLPEPDPLFPDEVHARRFNEMCAWIKSWFNVLPLDQAAALLKAGTLPARAACITFDDGYADNYHIALPILQHHGLTATFFIATGFLDGGRMWNDTIIETVRRRDDVPTIAARRSTITTLINQIKYLPTAERVAVTEELAQKAQVHLPTNLMMTSAEIIAMREAGMQIGAHTVSHPILARLTAEEAFQEVGDSKRFLEDLLGERVGMFAYPNGKPGEDYSPQTVEIVRSLEFDAAVSTQWGASRQGDDLLQIKRFTPWDKTRLLFGLRLMRNL